MSKLKVSLSKLRDDIHSALKLWHEPTDASSPLYYLEIFRQAKLQSDENERKATNKILLEGLKELEVGYAVEARLLRKRFLDGMTIHMAGNWLNLSESAIYRKQQGALKQLAAILQAKEVQARKERRTILMERLETPTYVQLIGIQSHLKKLIELLSAPGSPWIVSIEGMGGIGKTSLADAISREIIQKMLFEDFAWLSARQHIFNLGYGLKSIDQPSFTKELLVERLVEQLIPELFRSSVFSMQKAMSVLRSRLKENPHLIVIDNLETTLDVESLVPILYDLSNPTKFLLTSRESLLYETGLYHYNLPELHEKDVIHLLRHEAQLRNLPHLERASKQEFKEIYRIVGGNPLALRLVIGQTHVHSLEVILEELATARGKKVEMLYNFIFRQAWENLDEVTRRVFLTMPMVPNQGGTIDYLHTLCHQIEFSKLRDALDHLVALNLVDSRGDLSQRYYTIHNLTRTFLQEQVAKWM